MSHHHDVIVIGAGPAGLTASACLAEMGLDVLTLDEQSRIGGQIYRNIEAAPPDRRNLLGEDYAKGLGVADRFRKSGAAYENCASVWQVDPDGKLCYSRFGVSKQVRANYVIVATGAMERPAPIPGWTLSGVMGAGAANNLAKESGLSPSGRVVLAGSGPLLLLEASLLVKKGASIAAILETTPVIPSAPAIASAPKAVVRADFLWKGISMVREIKKAGVVYHKGVAHIRATGHHRVQAVEAMCANKPLRVEADLLLLHFGVIPNTQLFRQMGCKMVYKPDQRYWHPVCDGWGHTSCERIFAAGDGAVVAGAVAAQCKGELAALEVARCCGIIPAYERDMLSVPIQKALKHDSWPRPFVDAIYAPRPEQFVFEDSTVVCRCENITVGDLRKAVKEGVRELNEIKIVTRSGMGPCQGRMCGPALAEVLAAECDLSPAHIGLLNIRPPLKPVPLEEIAAMELMAGPTDEVPRLPTHRGQPKGP
jgi:thioredoxin reductase/bacterioferritin-associated ferredoxin